MSTGRLLCALVVGAACLCGTWFALGGAGVDRIGLVFRDLGARIGSNGALGAWGKQRNQRAQTRKATWEMPVFLDIVTLGISAGLSFDASLSLYCDRYDTPLANMVSSAMLSWSMGVTGRAEALQRLADDVDSPAMRRFSCAVNDALAFGTPLAEALGRQAQLIRDEQRSHIEEEIERLPVKMLIPLGTLIVPAMLLTILGPLLGPALSLV